MSDVCVRTRVQAFYEELPFNYEASEAAAQAHIRANPLTTYPDLDALLRREGSVRSVLEIGCGAGWFSNAVALHYRKSVVGVDLTGRALERARHIAVQLRTADRVQFVQADLFAYAPDTSPDLVASVGVLHHTHDCEAALRRVARFLRPGGWLFVGLYHRPGRQPFLDLFREILDAEGEEAAFRRYRALNPGRRDELFLRSWFRDQVLHPHETQHTLEEVWGWITSEGFAVRSTSINHFQPFSDPRQLFALEADYGALSHRRNRQESRFFPGFFTVLAQRP